jgi:hypothetical protein
VEYDGYLFSPLDKKIVKIPLSADKIEDNSHFVMNFPAEAIGPNAYSEVMMLENDGVLYIDFYIYMSHYGLYRLLSADGPPEFVIKTENQNGALGLRDSNLHPKELKFLYLGDGDVGYSWGDLYCYFTRENIAKKVVSYRSHTPYFHNFLGRMKDDSLLIANFVECEKTDASFGTLKATHIEHVTPDVKTKTITRTTLIDSKRMPEASLIFFDEDVEKLYFFGTGFWVYDMREDSFRQVVDFRKYIPKWPNDGSPYMSNDAYGGAFFCNESEYGDKFCASGDKYAIFIDREEETFEVSEKFDIGDWWKGPDDDL